VRTASQPNNNILVNRWSQDTESLLIFNPRDEAVRESHHYNPLVMSMPTNKLMEQQVLVENQHLKEQVREQQDLIQLQKAMLSEIITGAARQAGQALTETNQIDKRLSF
jgi:hypothetical protein